MRPPRLALIAVLGSLLLTAPVCNADDPQDGEALLDRAEGALRAVPGLLQGGGADPAPAQPSLDEIRRELTETVRKEVRKLPRVQLTMTDQQLRTLFDQARRQRVDARVAAALKLAGAADDPDLRLIYLLNAATADPGNLDVLTALADAATGDGAGDAARVLGVLELAPYEADPADIPEVLELIERVRRSAAPGGSGSRRPEVREDDLKTANARDDVRERLAAWLAANPTADPLTRRAAAANAEAVGTLDYCEACLTRLAVYDRTDRLDSEAALSVAQAVESASAGLWGLAPDRLDAAVTDRLERLPDDVKAVALKIAAVRSSPHMTAAKRLFNETLGAAPRKSGVGKLQAKFDHVQAKLKAARQELAQITDESRADEVGRVIGRFQTQLQKARQAQIDAYNRWAVQMAKSAFDDYESYTQMSEAEARQVFKAATNHARADNRTTLAEVDQALLTPEVARIYGDVLGKLLAEMSREAVVRTEKEMADESVKLKLSRF